MLWLWIKCFFCVRAYRFSSCPQRLQNIIHTFSQIHESVVQLKVQTQQQAADPRPHLRLFIFFIVILIFILLHTYLPLTICRMMRQYKLALKTKLFTIEKLVITEERAVSVCVAPRWKVVHLRPLVVTSRALIKTTLSSIRACFKNTLNCFIIILNKFLQKFLT